MISSATTRGGRAVRAQARAAHAGSGLTLLAPLLVAISAAGWFVASGRLPVGSALVACWLALPLLGGIGLLLSLARNDDDPEDAERIALGYEPRYGRARRSFR